MSLTKDVIESLKSAVTSKLKLMGAYTDEVTEYVLILVAKRKSEKEMSTDLQPLLNDYSAQFSSWVYSTLNQLVDSDKNANKTRPGRDRRPARDLNDNNEPELALEIDSNEFNDDEQQNEAPAHKEDIKSRLTMLQASSSESRPRAPIHSRIGAVINHSVNNDGFEDEDDDYGARRGNGSVASVIKVSERRFMPKSLQPNKAILFRAVDEANISVSQVVKKETPSIKSRLGPRVNPARGDERRVELSADEIAEPMPQNDANHNNTKFIITLKGFDESRLSNPNDGIANGQKRKLSADHEMNENEQDEAMDLDENAENSPTKKRKIRCTFWPACDKGAECPYVHPNKPCEAFPKCTYGIKCHFIHPTCKFDGYCTRLDCLYTHLMKKAPVAATSAIGNGAVAAAQSGKPQVSITLPPKQFFPKVLKSNYYSLNHKKSDVECKFGKLCKNATCPFAHAHLPEKSALKWVANKQPE